MSVDNRYNSDLYQKLKASVYASSQKLKSENDEKETENIDSNPSLNAINGNHTNIVANGRLSKADDDSNIKNENNKSIANGATTNDANGSVDCVSDFHSSLDALRNTIITLFEQYNLKYSSNSAVEFAVSQCRNSFVRVYSRLQSQMQTLENKNKALESQLSVKDTQMESEMDRLSKEYSIAMKQLQLKCDRQLKKTVDKAVTEKSVEMEKEFNETVKMRARQQMSQIRDSQSKEIKALKKELSAMQSKMDSCDKEWRLKCGAKDLIMEQLRTEMEKMRRNNCNNNYEWNSIMQQCKSELDSIKCYITEIKSDKSAIANRDFEAIESLHSSLQTQNEIWSVKEATYRREVQNLERHLTFIKAENNRKLDECRLENESILDECKKRMETVLLKKESQIKKLKRCLESTIAEYETNKKEMNQLLQLRDEQMKQLTNQLQI